MEMTSYIPVLVQIILGVVVAGGIIVASHIFGQRGKKTPSKTPPTKAE